MSQIDPSTVDVDNIISRIQAVRRGELPDDAVSIEELRAAIEAQRSNFRNSANAVATKAEGKTAKSSGKKTIIVPDLDLGF